MKSSSFLADLNSKSPDESDNSAKGTNPLYEALRDRRGSFRPQPKNTILYEVQKLDTLAGIAARFNTTPSELVNLNKLWCRTIFPSQIIYVPEPSSIPVHNSQSSASNPGTSVNGRDSPKPGHVLRIKALEDAKRMDVECHKTPSQIAEDQNADSLNRFLKINAKHITDGEGVASGVLLITPNHVMFDPNVSDPLVLEHGVEKYGVVAPFYMLARCALYTDIVRMRVKGSDQLRSDDNSLKIYHSTRIPMKKSQSDDNAIWLKHASNKSESEHGASCNVMKKLGIISEMSFDISEEDGVKTELESSDEINNPAEKSSSETCTTETICVEFPDTESTQIPERQPSSEEDDSENILTTSGEHSSKKTTFERTKSKLHKGFLKLHFPESIFHPSVHPRRSSLPAFPTSQSLQDLKSKVTLPLSLKKANTKEEEQKPNTSVTSYVNMVEEKPELFAPLDTLIPRPAKAFDDNPLYLCLRMGRPLFGSSSQSYTPIINFGCKLKQEYWFSIPRAKVDNLYWFLMRWVPHAYGEVYDINFEDLGFAPITDGEDEVESESLPVPESGRPRSASWAFPWRRKKSLDVTEKVHSPSWEFVSVSDLEPSLPSETSLPEMLGTSDILTEEQILKLNEHLPPRAVGYAWTLIYSTSLHGFSLKTLYREMTNFDSPVLIVISSNSGCVFGAVLSSPLKLSEHFYGNGESFLYTFHPEFKCFNWSGENSYFIKGNTGSFAVGASDGKFGLWLDDDLFHGCTKECKTFANDVLCDEEDFIVKALEAWGFV